MKNSRIKHGDALKVLKTLPDNSVDSLVTDPPSGINFMNKSWDSNKGGRDKWIEWLADIMKEAHRVLKPGAHGFVWALPRTSHWTATALENSGFEIRDVVMHITGQGFPKSHNVNKALEGVVCECDNKNMRDMQEEVSEKKQDRHSDEQNEILQLQVHGCMEKPRQKNKRASQKNSKQGTGRLDRRKQKELQEKYERCQKSSMEGRSNTEKTKGKLQGREICEMSKRISGDGTEGRIHNGTSSGDGNAPWTTTDEARSGSSQRPQSSKQQNRKSSIVSEQPNAQNCRRCGKPKIQKGLGTALKPAARWLGFRSIRWFRQYRSCL